MLDDIDLVRVTDWCAKHLSGFKDAATRAQHICLIHARSVIYAYRQRALIEQTALDDPRHLDPWLPEVFKQCHPENGSFIPEDADVDMLAVADLEEGMFNMVDEIARNDSCLDHRTGHWGERAKDGWDPALELIVKWQPVSDVSKSSSDNKPILTIMKDGPISGAPVGSRREDVKTDAEGLDKKWAEWDARFLEMIAEEPNVISRVETLEMDPSSKVIIDAFGSDSDFPDPNTLSVRTYPTPIERSKADGDKPTKSPPQNQVFRTELVDDGESRTMEFEEGVEHQPEIRRNSPEIRTRCHCGDDFAPSVLNDMVISCGYCGNWSHLACYQGVGGLTGDILSFRDEEHMIGPYKKTYRHHM
jgi:hypothetical protein